MQLNKVDLPAPFGPISAVIEPVSTAERGVVDCVHAAERLAHVAGLQQGIHSSTISSRRPRRPCRRKTISPMITSPMRMSRTYARSAESRYEKGGKSKKRVAAKRKPKNAAADGDHPRTRQSATENEDHPGEEGRGNRLEVVGTEEPELPGVEAAGQAGKGCPERERLQPIAKHVFLPERGGCLFVLSDRAQDAAPGRARAPPPSQREQDHCDRPDHDEHHDILRRRCEKEAAEPPLEALPGSSYCAAVPLAGKVDRSLCAAREAVLVGRDQRTISLKAIVTIAK